jgi:hypothetical protein
MYFILILLVLYFFNIFSLFLSQTVIVAFTVFGLLLYVKTIYRNLIYEELLLSKLDWIILFKYFYLMKNWHLANIRLSYFKTYNLAYLVIQIKNTIINGIVKFTSKLQDKYIYSIMENGLRILMRLRNHYSQIKEIIII